MVGHHPLGFMYFSWALGPSNRRGGVKLTGQFGFMLLHGLIIEPKIISRDTMLEDFILIFLFD